mmetsp:Transcript_11201/g.23497  ORF Transcript_11201/g.23497 Transcript_11201/m.23497 type:complete len:95 (+) Transcript_11201:236-520(+)
MPTDFLFSSALSECFVPDSVEFSELNTLQSLSKEESPTFASFTGFPRVTDVLLFLGLFLIIKRFGHLVAQPADFNGIFGQRERRCSCGDDVWQW